MKTQPFDLTVAEQALIEQRKEILKARKLYSAVSQDTNELITQDTYRDLTKARHRYLGMVDMFSIISGESHEDIKSKVFNEIMRQEEEGEWTL